MVKKERCIHTMVTTTVGQPLPTEGVVGELSITKPGQANGVALDF